MHDNVRTSRIRPEFFSRKDRRNVATETPSRLGPSSILKRADVSDLLGRPPHASGGEVSDAARR